MTTATLHPTEAGLLRDIVERPGDDAPRLILADWLKGRGEWCEARLLRHVLEHPRAAGLRLLYADWHREGDDHVRGELVRVQLAYKEKPHGSLARAWRLRAERLLDYHAGRWFHPGWRVGESLWGERDDPLTRAWVVGVPDADADADLTWRGGFVEAISCPCDDWLRYGPALVLAQPITEVRLVDVRAVPPGTAWTTYHPHAPHHEHGKRWPWMGDYKAWTTLHATEADLWAALSRDAVAWARKEARLPALEATP